MRSDYCPSRQQQKKLKRQKSVPHSNLRGRSRISQQELKARRSSPKENSSQQNKFWLAFISILLFIFGLALVIFLLRRHWLTRQKLAENYRILVLQNQQAQFLLELSPKQKQVLVVDLRQLENLTWSASQSAVTADESANQRLFFSLSLGQVIDQIVEQGRAINDQDQQAWKDFLLVEQGDNLQPSILSFLKHQDVTWQWPGNLNPNSNKNFACPVVVINGSEQQGLANQMAKMLESSGFSVIKRDGNNQLLKESYLAIDPNNTACETLNDEFSQLFPGKNIQADLETTKKYRASAVLFLGEDVGDLEIFFTDLFHGDF